MSSEVQEQSANYKLADLKPVLEYASDNRNLVDSLPIWLSAQTTKSAGRGRSTSNTHQYGVQKLRELILELAVRGKLVEQDPNDDDALTLLEKIANEKTKLVKERKIKKPKKLPEISGSEKSFPLPLGWHWARLQDISSYIQRGKGPKYSEQGRVRVISQKCVQNSGFDITPARFVEDASLDKYQPERFLMSDDLLWNSTGTGTVGRVNVLENINPNTLVADSHVTVIRPLLVSSRFICSFISAPGIQERIAPDHENSLVSGSTKQVELNTSQVTSIAVPVPPLAEQHRIVKKVDELMVLCDKLEQQQADAVQAHDTLVNVLLDTLTQSDNTEDFQQNWHRIAEHFDTLFTTESSIDQLKQTLLQLAVMGKLVPQDPNDEPASVLLEKIAEEKAQLVKEGKLKKQKPLPEITSKDLLFNPPEEWAVVRLGEICVIERGGSPRPIKAFLTNEPDGLNWIKIGDTEIGGKYISNTAEKITKEGLHKTRMVYPGDFLLTNSMSFGRPYITKIEGCIHDGWLRISPPSDIDKDYLYLLLSSSYVRNFFVATASGAVVQNLNSDKVRELPLPLPSISEQDRIVKKADELMALCDQLKDRLSQAQTLQQQLADAVVEQAVN